MVKRFLYFAGYVGLILLFTGLVIVQGATGTTLVRTLPFAVGYFLMAVNALPLAVIFAFHPQPAASSGSVYWLAPFIALQLWPLLFLAIHPALPATPVWRFLWLAYSIGLILFILIVWLLIAALPSLG